MSFTGLLIHQITTYRNRLTGVGIQRGYILNLQDQPCLIQPVSAEFANKINEVFGRTYNLFVDLTVDIALGDKIVDQDGKEYRVTGSQRRNYGASAPHLTFVITEQVKSGPEA